MFLSELYNVVYQCFAQQHSVLEVSEHELAGTNTREIFVWGCGEIVVAHQNGFLQMQIWPETDSFDFKKDLSVVFGRSSAFKGFDQDELRLAVYIRANVSDDEVAAAVRTALRELFDL
jgi:hypothetical protein